MDGKLKHIWPIAAACAANRSIGQQAAKSVAAQETPANGSQEEQNRMEELWCDSLQQSGVDLDVIESIANNVYSTEDRRIEHIENKGSQMLVGAGIMASLMLGVLGLASDAVFVWPRNPETPLLAWAAIKLLMTVWAVAELFMTTLAIYKATRLAPKYVPTVGVLAKSLSRDRIVLRWAAKHFVAIQSNMPGAVKKANWVDAAQSHFVRGILVMIFAVCLALFTP